MNTLFIVHTPYHLILSIGICLRYKIMKPDIIIYLDFDIAYIEIEKLHDIFENIYFIDINKNNNHILRNIFMLYANRNRIKTIKNIISVKYDNIFIFNDSIIETQFILSNRISINNGNIIYVEDGSIIYLYNGLVHENIIKSFIKRIMYFDFKYQSISKAIGMYSDINYRMALWPDIVSNIYESKKIYFKEIEYEILNIGIKNYPIEFKKLNIQNSGKKLIILLEHIDFFKENKSINLGKYGNIIYNILSNYKFDKIYIKYHPRDNTRYLDEFIDKLENINFIQNYYPIELYYSFENLVLLSISSTCLFTAAKLSKNIKVISLLNILNSQNIDLIDKFEKIGIYNPNDLRGLEEVLQ